MKPRFRSGFSITEYLPGENILDATVYFRLYKRRKVVKATLEARYNYYVKVFEATAVCHPQDVFDLNTGLDLALNKVMDKFIKSNTKDLEVVAKQMDDRTIRTIQAIVKKHTKMKDKKIYQFQ